VLDPTELASLFDAFSCVVRVHPIVLYWVHRLNDEEYLVSSFVHSSMVKYSGLEVAHVTPDEIGYYRLPGAKVGGRGHVEPGVYPMAVQAPGRTRHLVRIRKCDLGLLHLDEVRADAVPDGAASLPLTRRVLNRSKFADEMQTIIERAIEWDYQRALLGEPSLISDADWTEMTSKCAGISNKIDALLRALAVAVARKVES
jgi:hypothetical protein